MRAQVIIGESQYGANPSAGIAEVSEGKAMARIKIHNSAGQGLKMKANDASHFASNVPGSGAYEEFFWDVQSWDSSDPAYLDVISLQTTGGTGPFADIGLYYDFDTNFAADFLADVMFWNGDGKLTLEVSNLGTLASDAEVTGGWIDFGGWGFWNDTIIGNKFNDLLYGHEGQDTLVGNGGNDKLIGGVGVDKLKGGTGNDTLLGGLGKDRLEGGSGNDLLKGGSGNDVLVAGAGRDVLSGGGGADRFVFKRGDGRDTITDFNADADTIVIGTGASKFRQLDISRDGRDVVVEFANVSITIEDTRVREIDADVFSL